MFKLEISLKRVQSFIFDVPKLKAMLGANAMIGETMRNVLPRLMERNGKGCKFIWPEDIKYDLKDDCLKGLKEHLDDPAMLWYTCT